MTESGFLQEHSRSQGPSAVTRPMKSGKRKRSDKEQELAHKRAKPSRSKTGAEDHARRRDVESGINDDIARMDGRLLSDYVAQKAKRFEKHLTALELEDKYVSALETAWCDTTEWDRRRDLDNLPTFLEHFYRPSSDHRSLAWAPETNGAPHTIVITGAALRAADLSRAVRKFKTKDAAIAKLFAKHIKFKEAENFVKSSRIAIAVGTPSRIIDLVEAGTLSVDKLERIVVDGSHVDQKKRSIFDMRETLMPLVALLNRPEFKARYGAPKNKLDLLVY